MRFPKPSEDVGTAAYSWCGSGRNEGLAGEGRRRFLKPSGQVVIEHNLIDWAKLRPTVSGDTGVGRKHDAIGRASAGYAGTRDGWQDFARHGAMAWEYSSAGSGNITLLGELPRSSVLALAFGSSTESAATLALTALYEPYERMREWHLANWTECTRDRGCGNEVGHASRPNYRSRFRGPSAVERTVNRLIGRQLGNGQHMYWTKRGAHLLLQVRCAVLDGELFERFQRWFPDIGTRQIGLPWNWVSHHS